MRWQKGIKLKGKWSKRKRNAKEHVKGTGGRRDEEVGLVQEGWEGHSKLKFLQDISTSGHLLLSENPLDSSWFAHEAL